MYGVGLQEGTAQPMPLAKIMRSRRVAVLEFGQALKCPEVGLTVSARRASPAWPLILAPRVFRRLHGRY